LQAIYLPREWKYDIPMKCVNNCDEALLFTVTAKEYNRLLSNHSNGEECFIEATGGS
jgi:hypothetical protein